MVGVEDRNEDVAEEEAPGPSSVPDAAAPAPVPAPSAEDGGVIFVLEKASLEAAKVGKNYQLLNCDDHATFLKRHKRDPALYRPDILHQALLAILDSTLNKAGRLKGLYVHTEKNVLIQINPHIRIPRTFKRFCGLMLQLLQKLSIRASNGPDKLMRIVKQPVTRHLPLGARRIGMSYSAPKVVQLSEYVAAAGLSSTYVFVVGAMAHGKIDVDYIDDLVAVSEYPLSAMWCIARICSSLEQQWHIL
ncbi:unnamed protein product [Sphagnum troendelagicum]|uniref:Ribosomal RNA small subunit methyltransferase NEP1 n=1 Tax=Sphagnum troendelagicum TaxID=128251 RepID=A0ABP0TV52_9BRYO